MSSTEAKKAKKRKARKTRSKVSTGVATALNTISFESLPSPKPTSALKNLPEVSASYKNLSVKQKISQKIRI